MSNQYLELVKKAQAAQHESKLTSAMSRARDANRMAHAARDEGKTKEAQKLFKDKDFHCINLLLLPRSTLVCEGVTFRVNHKGNEIDGGVHVPIRRFDRAVEGHPRLSEGQKKQLLRRAETAIEQWLKKENAKKEAEAHRAAEKKARKARK